MRKLLITGFEPFGGQLINPSWEAVKALPEQIADFQLYKLEIPTVFGTAGQKVLDTAEVFQPDVILCIGQAGGRSAVTPERIGVNIRDARSCDNAGNCPKGEKVNPHGPAAYFATIPVQRAADAITEAGIPSTVSNSAGTFVCNDVLYTLLHHYCGSATTVGFLHVPYLPEQGTPSLPLENIVRALQTAICVL